ncbi:agmatine deiminase family protein [Xanthomonas translucens]|uniref:agmatine deiminase family protein n=1 Tax=Xanthomonas campestris pv. translucens TaxID=343 RepID=UPI00071E9D21|nr:agmatine deiminase family protein [Xanthomonas translucens]QEN93545.1 agmatine deiminase family protein [Xanthomonas translucens pv. undulosa]QSQ40516.1 agmatine deiminase family protein [Xanthomonas translucens pv. translucens]QSQ48288.1 agmatine deiminase family protein [Xanthomonas translucens pv. undulosa]WLA10317.1 agmatine deiminase family protein [Xanthomonas translucens]
MTDRLRLPAEWEPQSAILIAWPHAGTDWAERLAEVEETYIALVAAIARYQRVLICVADADLQIYAEARLRSARVDMQRVRFVEAEYDDTWLRDSGPITLARASGGFQLLDFRFTGWGGKFQASRDDQLVSALAAQRLFADSDVRSIDFALEGGAIDSDGAGTLLTTWQCLHERHPQRARESMSRDLADWLAQQRVLWLDHGYLEGDDTDAHIDTLARFASEDAIVYQACDDAADSHYAELQAMGAELAALLTADGRPYRLFPLPWAQPVLDHGRRLAASYANFLIVNGAVLMPAYGDAADAQAQAVIAQAFPQHEIVPIPCRALIWQNGSLHCITMQLPEGVLAA